MRNLNYKHFVIFITLPCCFSCYDRVALQKSVSSRQYKISDSLLADPFISATITPYRDHINAVLDAPLSYAPILFTKKGGNLNTNIGNLMADIVRTQTDSLLVKQHKPKIDFVLLNHGGVRSIISVGPVTERTAFEVMPFENTIVVVHLNGETLQKLIEYLVAQKTAHPISGMQLILNPNGSLKSASIQGNPIDFNKSYAVATSNFLMGGGDGMTFFSESSEIYETGYLIRNAMIDYFKSTDTLKTAVDDRFYQLPQS